MGPVGYCDPGDFFVAALTLDRFLQKAESGKVKDEFPKIA